jgi:hypothetical protein
VSIDQTRGERHAMDSTIEAAPVQPEPCAGFMESADDSLVCACGWLEHDHGELAKARADRRRVRPPSVLIVRRAS